MLRRGEGCLGGGVARAVQSQGMAWLCGMESRGVAHDRGCRWLLTLGEVRVLLEWCCSVLPELCCKGEGLGQWVLVWDLGGEEGEVWQDDGKENKMMEIS